MFDQDSTTLVCIPKKKPQNAQNSYLAVILNDAVGKKFKLAGSMIIGRKEDCEIRIDHRSISRKHARIMLEANGYSAMVEDLASLNGTYYRGKRIQKMRIHDGELIEFGNVPCKFFTDTHAEHGLLDMSSLDQMTGIYNKRYFLDSVNERIRQSAGHDTLLSLLTFDIDHFKKINDTHGHVAGDMVLKRICRIVAGLLPETLVFARIGGEEFAIMLPGSGINDALSLAETVRGTIENSDFEFMGTQIPVTLSAGVCEYSKDMKKAEQFMHKADCKLYLAKNRGRNNVCA
ncbi:MAG: GGDEF domain-containing protein [Methylococcaceae bacterium]|nr:GGDEF domain-containing protein [Methylococcaceae bacterium]